MKKGFTLVELLAVIVILAIIMVIAAPHILKIIDSSRDTAWDDNVKLIKRAMEIDYSTTHGVNSVMNDTVCGGSSDNFKKKLIQISSLDEKSTKIGIQIYNDATSTCTFKLTPQGEFAGREEVTMTCTKGLCDYE